MKKENAIRITLSIILSLAMILPFGNVMASETAITNSSQEQNFKTLVVAKNDTTIEGNIDCKGNLSSNNSITFKNSTYNIAGSCTSKAIIKENSEGNIMYESQETNTNSIPNLTKVLNDNVKTIKKIAKPIQTYSTHKVSEWEYGLDSINYHASHLYLNSLIATKDSINIDSANLLVEDNDFAIIYAQNGDIKFDTSDINFKGILYAPNGNVNINSANLNFQGVIIAKDIKIKSNIINLNPHPLADALLDSINSINNFKLSHEINSNNINLSWPKIINCDLYQVMENKNYSNLELIKDTSNTNYLVEKLAEDGIYQYQVSAKLILNLKANSQVLTFSKNGDEITLIEDNQENFPLPDGVEVYEKPLDPNSVMTDPSTGVKYVKNQILLTAKKGVTKEQVESIINGYQGKIVGYISPTNDYQVEFTRNYSKAEMDNISLMIEYNPNIECVLEHRVMESSSKYPSSTNLETKTYNSNGTVNDIYIPKDPWLVKKTDTHGIPTSEIVGPENWYEENPSGSNWGVESIKAPSAWQYKNQMRKVRVGIIDSGILSHPDLSVTARFNYENWKPPVIDKKDDEIEKGIKTGQKNHGTHVAGIIGATHNNNIGITGVSPNADLYSVAYLTNNIDTQQSQSFSLKRSLAELIIRDVKVINFSAGEDINKSKLNDNKWIEDNTKYNKELFDNFLISFINEGYEFLIVQAAGNYSNFKDIGWVDSKYSNVFNLLKNNKEIEDRIIVVGAYKNNLNNSYEISEFSQIGEKVDVLAPGTDIGSLSENNSAMLMSGTSQATPHVSGVAAMVWGINPSLSSKQVKEIIVDTAKNNKTLSPKPNSKKLYLVNESNALNKQYPLLDAKGAVEKAKTTQGEIILPSDKGMVMGKIDFSKVLLLTDDKLPSIELLVQSIDSDIPGRKIRKTTFSDVYGEFSFLLPAGKYQLIIKSDKFRYSGKDYFIQPFTMNIEIKNGEVNYIENIILLNKSQSNKEITINGTIRDAISTNVVSGVSLSFIKGWDYYGGEYVKDKNGNIIKALTNKDGLYKANLVPGYYTAVASKDGYITSKFNIAIAPEEDKFKNPSFNNVITPKLKDGEIRIVLTWGESPNDLDSHLIGPTPNNHKQFHTYFSQKAFYYGATKYAELDVDDTSSYGPETTTIYKQSNGKYRFYVHDYSNGGRTNSRDMSFSGAQVMVYMGNDHVSKFNIPTNKAGTVWTVFEMEGKSIKPINTIGNNIDPPKLSEQSTIYNIINLNDLPTKN